jgi:hypothetical protein
VHLPKILISQILSRFSAFVRKFDQVHRKYHLIVANKHMVGGLIGRISTWSMFGACQESRFVGYF